VKYMIDFRIVERGPFEVVGRKTWISGQDNNLFSLFWEKCRSEDLFEIFERISGFQPGLHTKGTALGISRVEKDPSNRAFYYMIAIEKTNGLAETSLESYPVPSATWAVFECRGKVPGSIAEAEIYAFTQWLPASGFVHAPAPEMEVYLEGENSDNYVCEFWLPVKRKDDEAGG
jgi:AraC family transcriptional regulator